MAFAAVARRHGRRTISGPDILAPAIISFAVGPQSGADMPIAVTVSDTSTPIDLFVVGLTAGAAAPSAAQVIAGTDASNVAAPFVVTWSASASGSTSDSGTPPSAGTYDFYLVCRDSASPANISAVESDLGIIYTDPYTEVGVVFDGTNDYLSRASDFTGAADGKTALLFFSVDFTGAIGGTLQQLYSGPGNQQILERKATSGDISVQWRDTLGNVNISITSGVVSCPDAGRANILVVLNADATSRIYVWKESTGAWADGGSDATGGGANLEFTPGSHALFARTTAANKVPCTAYRAAMWLGVAPDITSSTVRDYFTNSTTGETVSPSISVAQYGTPIFDFYGNAATWNAGTNQGSGGNMTMNGAVV